MTERFGFSRLEENASSWRRIALTLVDGLRSTRRPLRFVTAEFVLDRWPNGGDVIAFRAAWCGGAIFLLGIWIHSALEPGVDCSMSLTAIRQESRDHLPWFGALFGGVYAALYARFASQWRYVADVYNMIMREWVQDEARSPRPPVPNIALATWRRALIYDALELHLARKSSVAPLLTSCLQKDSVREDLGIAGLPKSQRRILARLELDARAERAELRQLESSLPRLKPLGMASSG